MYKALTMVQVFETSLLQICIYIYIYIYNYTHLEKRHVLKSTYLYFLNQPSLQLCGTLLTRA